jgi:predicted NAD-dependent protein-ADP-ribosyltransferase YbiA (DUF1768 family)
MLKPLNVWSMSDEEIGRKMSNFAHTPFLLDGVEFASVEAFYVWLLLSTTATERKLEKVRLKWGLQAKRLGPHAKPPAVVYRGVTMPPGGPDHIALIRRALRAKLDAHVEIAREFVATAPRPIAHETGHPDRPGAEFPRETFCRLLSELRDELAREHG